jgi:hypothetical protein
MTATAAATTRAIKEITSQLGATDMELTENEEPDQRDDPEAEDE